MYAVTHDGIFHSDDVFGAVVVRRSHPAMAIRRSRDPQTLAGAAIRFDVGGRACAATGDYDHHQREGAGVRANGVPYASFGLLWRVWGSAICGDSDVANEVDRALVQSVDAHDNGHPITQPLGDALQCTVSHLISNFNPGFDEPQEDRFFEAVAFADAILTRVIARARGKIAAESIIADAVAGAIDPRIVVIDTFVPWQEALCAQSADALYIVYPSAGTWRAQVVPIMLGQPGARRPLPESWAGLDGADLVAATGIADATFAHRGRFIVGAQSREGAVALARLAVL